jgi:hypothetical protein
VTRLRYVAILGALGVLSAFVATSACSTDFSTSDAGASDGGGLGDATTGAEGGGVDAGPPADFCKTAVMPFLACDAFDQSATLGKQWVHDDNLIGSIAIDSLDSRSSPNSVLAQIPMHSATINPYHLIYLTAEMGSGSFESEFDFKLTLDVASTDPDGGVTYGCLFEVTTDGKSNASVCFGSSSFFIQIDSFADEGGAPVTQRVDVASTPPLDAWHHVKVGWSFLPSNGVISLEMDGTMMGATTPARTLPSSESTGRVYPEIGLDSNGALGDATGRFDNVVLRAK